MHQLGPAVADPATADARELGASIREMINHPEYPCLGARSVFRQDRATVEVYDQLGGQEGAQSLLADLRRFASGVDLDQGFASFIAMFRGPHIRDEKQFEELLWQHLRAVHAADDQPWTPDVSADPQDPHFAFSVAGSAYFVIGLHPRASRHARRSAVPTLVFKPARPVRAAAGSGDVPQAARPDPGARRGAPGPDQPHVSQGLRQLGITSDPPTSMPGDRLVLRAEMDLHVGLTVCSAEKSNGGVCKPIEFDVTLR